MDKRLAEFVNYVAERPGTPSREVAAHFEVSDRIVRNWLRKANTALVGAARLETQAGKLTLRVEDTSALAQLMGGPIPDSVFGHGATVPATSSTRVAYPLSDLLFRNDWITLDGLAEVLVHHQRKMDDPDPFNTLSGTNGITGAADTTMVLDRKRGEKRAVLRVTGRDVVERELVLEFNDCRWELSEDQHVEHEEERPVPRKVTEVIRFMEGRLGWAGTATELIAQAGSDARAEAQRARAEAPRARHQLLDAALRDRQDHLPRALRRGEIR